MTCSASHCLYLPDFPLDLWGLETSCPLQKCQSHPECGVRLQTACPALQHELQAACISIIHMIDS